jgi:hypothetical protein
MDKQGAQHILKDCVHDPNALRHYDLMRGGFVWSDEMPSEARLAAILLLAKVIAYRASLTLGKPRQEFEGEWNDLKEAVPTWPGFREERISDNLVKRDLMAEDKKTDRCIARLEKKLKKDGHI